MAKPDWYEAPPAGLPTWKYHALVLRQALAAYDVAREEAAPLGEQLAKLVEENARMEDRAPVRDALKAATAATDEATAWIHAHARLLVAALGDEL